MPYTTGETPEVAVKNQLEQPGTVTRVHFAQGEEDLICIRWDGEGPKLLSSPASEYTLPKKYVNRVLHSRLDAPLRLLAA
jgi:hypothetical protein